METYGMPSPDDPAIDVYHQYISQTDYRCERPEDGDHLRMRPECCDDLTQDFVPRSSNFANECGGSSYRNEASNNYHYEASNNYRNDSGGNYRNEEAAFGGAGYRLPWRVSMEMRRMNSRNGLYSPTELRAGGGDYFNSLPGLGEYARPMTQHARRRWL